MEKQSPTSATDPGQQEFARQVLRAEADAIGRIEIDQAFDRAVDLIIESISEPGGSVIVSGVGKSGLIGQKISATFSSTGTHSHFLHPTEALHGDLGRVRRGDVVLALSYGGNTDEMVNLALILKQDQVPVVAIVGKPDCHLGRLASIVLGIGDIEEACPLNLAPTASTTATLALGDALALAVSRRREFGIEDFKKVHPGGGLGRQLTPIIEAMRFKAGQNLPTIEPGQTLAQAYAEADRVAESTGLRKAGALVIVNPDQTLAGIFTDGDLRRLIFDRHAPNLLDQPISSVMTANPRRLTGNALVRDAVQMIREFRIDEVPVVDEENHVLGLIDVQDLMALKVIEG
jgi:arabinose-5-phosphate isomerase